MSESPGCYATDFTLEQASHLSQSHWNAGQAQQAERWCGGIAVMTLIDLMISVHSAPIHLAGALGRPAWAMLAFVPCWRWLLERDDSPWYPSVRLFRQPGPDQWQPMVESMAQALRQLADAS